LHYVIAEAQGEMSILAKRTHLNRQNLYNVLSTKDNPTLDTFGLILKGLEFNHTRGTRTPGMMA